MKIGIDIGGVIMGSSVPGEEDTSFFSDNFLRTPVSVGAVDTIWRITEHFGRDNVFIVSKCGPIVQRKTLLWMDHHEFCDGAGIDPKNIFFCLKRYEKAPICEELGISAFIDDKLEVLSYLEKVPTRILFRPNPLEIIKFQEFLPMVTQVSGWTDVLTVLGINERVHDV
jgi:hypothetical protein